MVIAVSWQDADSSSAKSFQYVFPDGSLSRVMLSGGHVGRSHANNLKEYKSKKSVDQSFILTHKKNFPHFASAKCECAGKRTCQEMRLYVRWVFSTGKEEPFLRPKAKRERSNGISPWARKWNPPPPSGIFADMYHFKASPEGIWKMHVCTWLVGGCGCAAPFFSSAKSHRLPTPRNELTSSETPLPPN